jgi:hypothetical protein
VPFGVASEVIDRSRLRHRVKYEAWGLATQARARHRLADHQGSADAAGAVAVARPLGDPATLLECLGVLLELDGSDAVLEEAQRTAQGILAAVSQEALQRSFVTTVSAKFPMLQLGDTPAPFAAAARKMPHNLSFQRRV